MTTDDIEFEARLARFTAACHAAAESLGKIATMQREAGRIMQDGAAALRSARVRQ